MSDTAKAGWGKKGEPTTATILENIRIDQQDLDTADTIILMFLTPREAGRWEDYKIPWCESFGGHICRISDIINTHFGVFQNHIADALRPQFEGVLSRITDTKQREYMEQVMIEGTHGRMALALCKRLMYWLEPVLTEDGYGPRYWEQIDQKYMGWAFGRQEDDEL